MQYNEGIGGYCVSVNSIMNKMVTLREDIEKGKCDKEGIKNTHQ